MLAQLKLESADSEQEGMKPSGAMGGNDDELDFSTKIIKILNETYSIELTNEVKVEFKRMQENVYSNAELFFFLTKETQRIILKISLAKK